MRYKVRLERLTTNEVKTLFLNSKKIKYQNIVIYYNLSPSENSLCRFAVSVPKKNIRKAVRRNKIKRRIRYILQQQKISEIANKNKITFSILVLYNLNVVLDYNSLKQQVDEVLDQMFKYAK